MKTYFGYGPSDFRENNFGLDQKQYDELTKINQDLFRNSVTYAEAIADTVSNGYSLDGKIEAIITDNFREVTKFPSLQCTIYYVDLYNTKIGTPILAVNDDHFFDQLDKIAGVTVSTKAQRKEYLDAKVYRKGSTMNQSLVQSVADALKILYKKSSDTKGDGMTKTERLENKPVRDVDELEQLVKSKSTASEIADEKNPNSDAAKKARSEYKICKDRLEKIRSLAKELITAEVDRAIHMHRPNNAGQGSQNGSTVLDLSRYKQYFDSTIRSALFKNNPTFKLQLKYTIKKDQPTTPLNSASIIRTVVDNHDRNNPFNVKSNENIAWLQDKLQNATASEKAAINARIEEIQETIIKDLDKQIYDMSDELGKILKGKTYVLGYSTLSSLMSRVARINNFACTGRWFCPECGKEMESSKCCNSCGYTC